MSIIIELPETMTFRGENKSQIEVDLTQWANPQEFVAFLMQQGWSIRMQRCTASAKTTGEFQKMEQAMLASMKLGELPVKGAKTGLGTSLEDKIATRFLSEQGQKGKIADLHERWLSFARVTILNNVEPDVKAMLQKDLGQLSELARENLDRVKELARVEDSWIEIHKELTTPKVKPAKTGMKITLGPIKIGGK